VGAGPDQPVSAFVSPSDQRLSDLLVVIVVVTVGQYASVSIGRRKYPVIQTRLLLSFAAILTFFIGIVLLGRAVHGPQTMATEARAKLCGSYYQYVDISHDVIKQLDTMCWRGDAPVRDDS
jgi:hypothetical protein